MAFLRLFDMFSWSFFAAEVEFLTFLNFFSKKLSQSRDIFDRHLEYFRKKIL